MLIRDRIKELRRVKASDLIKNAKNWRKHPEEQRGVLEEMLEKIGYAGALIGRDTANGVELLDGHLRAETTPNMKVPVLIVDLNDEEAKMLLATYDPIAAMAEKDAKQLRTLLEETELIEGEFLRWVETQPKEEVVPYLPPDGAFAQGNDEQASSSQQGQASPPPRVPDRTEPPEEFKSYDEDIETTHECPRCQFRY